MTIAIQSGCLWQTAYGTGTHLPDEERCGRPRMGNSAFCAEHHQEFLNNVHKLPPTFTEFLIRELDEFTRAYIAVAASPLAKFIAKHKVRFEAKRIASRPDKLMTDLSRHFECRLTTPAMRYTEGMTVYFSQGAAHITPPTVEDVLESLASDAAGYENAREFEDWASEYGYDTDSRSAEKTFNAVKEQAEQLKSLLGEAAYKELLWKTERQ
jgi:hypothetical protein